MKTANKIVNGDYIFENGKVVTVGQKEQLIQNIKTELYCKLGEFYPDKNFGSTLKYIFPNSLQEENVICCVKSCLSKYKNIYVKSAKIKGNEITLDLIINSDDERVVICL